jgi:hypothetical protein
MTRLRPGRARHRARPGRPTCAFGQPCCWLCRRAVPPALAAAAAAGSRPPCAAHQVRSKPVMGPPVAQRAAAQRADDTAAAAVVVARLRVWYAPGSAISACACWRCCCCWHWRWVWLWPLVARCLLQLQRQLPQQPRRVLQQALQLKGEVCTHGTSCLWRRDMVVCSGAFARARSSRQRRVAVGRARIAVLCAGVRRTLLLPPHRGTLLQRCHSRLQLRQRRRVEAHGWRRRHSAGRRTTPRRALAAVVAAAAGLAPGRQRSKDAPPARPVRWHGGTGSSWSIFAAAAQRFRLRAVAAMLRAHALTLCSNELTLHAMHAIRVLECRVAPLRP